MSNPLYERATHSQRFTIDGAVEYFRLEELKPLRVGDVCPHCHNGQLKINPIEVDERIQLRIGAYRIAICGEGCFAYSVVYPLRKPKHEDVTVQSKTSQAEYNALMATWQEANKVGPDATMGLLRRKWANEGRPA